MEDIKVVPFNEVHFKIITTPSIESEIRDYFTFDVPNAKHMPKFKKGLWDGKMRLYAIKNRTLYKGLYEDLKKFADEYGYTINDPFVKRKETSIEEIKEFLKDIKVKISPRDYQLQYMKSFIDGERNLLLSPTASGKSFILYALTRWYNKKTLLIVPTISLVSQMRSDFESYTGDDWAATEKISLIMSGREKFKLNDVVISTWQSIFNMPKNWFQQFEFVMVDEAHSAKAASIIKIMESMVSTSLRLGTTGTLDGTEVNEMTIKGLFGPIVKHITTNELIEQGFLSKIKINGYLLKYNKETRKNKGKTYADEVQLLIGHKKRNAFITKLACKLKGNVFILFQYVDKHGEILYNMIIEELKKQNSNRKVFFIAGATSADKREEIRKEIDSCGGDTITVASTGTSSVGTNIVNLNHIIFASPSKSRIRVLQSVGRGLRKSNLKINVSLHDVADDLSTKKGQKNFTYNHFINRLKMYVEEKFPYDIREFQIETEE